MSIYLLYQGATILENQGDCSIWDM